MSAGGRQQREDKRRRSRSKIEQLLENTAKDLAPWLISNGSAPRENQSQLKELRRVLGLEARTVAEAVAFSEALHDRIDEWNQAHPGAEVIPPAAVKLLDVRPPAWTAQSLDYLRAARSIRDGFEGAYICLKTASPEEAMVSIAGLVVASALFDSACLVEADLEHFSAWLADPEGAIYAGSDLPAWIELKTRIQFSKGRRKKGSLRKASGLDSDGEYALRRLFLAPRTLELVARHDNIVRATGGVTKEGTKKVRSPKGLASLIAKSCGNSGVVALRSLLKGASLLVQARSNGPDHTMAMLAQRRMDNYAADPKSWRLLLRGGISKGVSAAAAIGVEELTTAHRNPERSNASTELKGTEFFHLHRCMSVSPRTSSDMTTSSTKLTEGKLIKRFNNLAWNDETPSSLLLLRDWYLHMLTSGGIRTSSIRRYHSTIGALFYEMAGNEGLQSCDSDTLEELFGQILEADLRSELEQSNLRSALGKLHKFAMESHKWDFPQITEDLLIGKSAVAHIHSTLLGRDSINRARDILLQEYGLPPNVASAADAAMLAMSRGGLRIGEATKALLSHYEDVVNSGLDAREATLFVRPSVFGNNKTPGAYRQVQLMKLMTKKEAKDFKTYLDYRRRLSPKGPLFGVEQDDGTVAPFNANKLGEVIAECLRRATGLQMATSHGLRRAAASGVFLAIHETKTPDTQLGPFLDRLTGWDRADRKRVVETVAPHQQVRDRWQSLARFLGHGGPEMTFEAYIMVADLAVYESCAASFADKERANEHLSNLPLRRVDYKSSAQYSVSGVRPTITSNDTLAALLKALTYLDEGYLVRQAERAANLSDNFVKDRHSAALAWGGLKTNRKKNPKLRLQPTRRKGCLAPSPLNGKEKHNEAMLLAKNIVDLAEELHDEVEEWLLMVLHDASQGNSGTRFRTPEELKAWCAIAVQLCDPSRWLVERVDPNGKPDDAEWLRWSNSRHKETQYELRKVKTAKSVTARSRLLAKKKKIPNTFSAPNRNEARKGNPSDTWDGCVRFAAHLAAIYLGLEPYPPKPKKRNRIRGHQTATS